MIREGKKLPVGIEARIPAAVTMIAKDSAIVALYAFGSLARDALKPLSDLDFGVLLSDSLSKRERYQKCIDLIGILGETLETDEIDLVILNDDPPRFAYNILKSGKLLHCRDQSRLLDFIEKTVKLYLDFKPVRDQFDQEFLEGIGYHG